LRFAGPEATCRMTDECSEKKWAAAGRWMRAYGKTILITVAVVMVIRWQVIEPFYIPSASMAPTLKQLDRILVSKIAYLFHKPKRWEVMVFRDPQDHGRNFIKRVVGLPGESLLIIDGEVYINGHRAPKPSGRDSLVYTSRGTWGTREPVEIPAGCYFVLGDNSGSSSDSRTWKFVPAGDIIGKAVTVIWPLNRIQVIR